MTHRFINHLRGNAIAYVALFVALGGTSYAATSLPWNSVGTRQLRNGAVTAAKLSHSVGDAVAAVTELNAGGTVLPSLSTPKRVRTEDWRLLSPNATGLVVYPHAFPRTCAPLVSPIGPDTNGVPSVSANPLTLTGFSKVQIEATNVTGFTLVIVCPAGA